jgi:F-type H+-transporting ATPase subunit b
MHLDPSTILLQTINFAVLVWLLNRFLYKPVLAMIEARQAEVQRQMDEAATVKEQAKRELAEVQTAREGIAAERDAALKEAARSAGEAAEARHVQAEREADTVLDGARRTLEDERKRAFDEARRLALDLGAHYTRRLAAEMPVCLRAEAWIEPIEAHLAALPVSQRSALAGQLAEGEALRVVTAVPLSPAATQAWRDRLCRLIGDVSISFEADAALVAGAELHFPTSILSFSWHSALAAMESELAHADAV